MPVLLRRMFNLPRFSIITIKIATSRTYDFRISVSSCKHLAAPDAAKHLHLSHLATYFANKKWADAHLVHQPTYTNPLSV